MSHDTIFISELHVECIVGILPHERVHAQPVLFDVELSLDTSLAAHSGDIAVTCDYARVADELQTLMKFRRYHLLERAAEELSAMLLGVHPNLAAVRLRLNKPHALRDRTRGVGVEIHRRADALARSRERTEFGEVEILHQNNEAGLYLLHIDAGAEIPAHYHAIMRELEWLVDGELERDGVRLQGFAPASWSKHHAHRYVNVGARRATLFCCDSPPFVREDEIVVA